MKTKYLFAAVVTCLVLARWSRAEEFSERFAPIREKIAKAMYPDAF